MLTELVSMPAIPGVGSQIAAATPPVVTSGDMYAALLADARKHTTRRARIQDALHFSRFLGYEPDRACAYFVSAGFAGANALATAYLDSMLSAKLAPSTINRRLSTLRRLATLARRFGVATFSIEVEGLRVEPYRDTAGVGRSGWLRMLARAEQAAESSDVGKRDLVILLLLHDHGMRRAEVSALDLADVDSDGGRLMILGKGRGEKSPMRLNKPALIALDRYLEAMAPRELAGPLFVRLDRARPRVGWLRLTPDGIHKLVMTLGKRARIARRAAPHKLRHDAVTTVLDLTEGNLVAAQRFARHKDPRTTMKYDDNRRDVAGAMADLLGDDAKGHRRGRSR
jgi:integrase/recombinase XerC